MTTSIISTYEFFYDGQMSRYLEQVVRSFSGVSYETGTNANGSPQTLLVPCHMALTDRMVANIRANGSENILNSCPQITVWQTGLRGRKDDVQNPGFIEHLQVTERGITDGKYNSSKGNMYSVDRLMPIPLTMDVQVDIWTSNQLQKYQLVEQIMRLVYPQFQIQNSENALDWSASTWCFVEEDFTWTSRSIPIGTANEIDIFTLKLRIPMYLNSPAKVKEIRRIEQVVAPILAPPLSIKLNDPNTIDEVVANIVEGSQTLAQEIVSPQFNYWILVNGGIITLLSDKKTELLSDGSIPSWTNLLALYGTFNPSISQIRISLTSDINGAFVIGTIQDGSEPNQLVWSINVDTLPANTLMPIDGVIDPLKTFPGHGLLGVVNGQRYMLMNDVGNSVAWGDTFSANANDIIQYSTAQGKWVVAFDSRINMTNQYVLNLYSTAQLFWNGKEWAFSINNYYPPGFWRIDL